MSTTTAGPQVAASEPTQPEPEKAKAKQEPRPYVVLRNTTLKATSPGGVAIQTWEFVRNVDATSQEQAVRKVAEILIAASEEDSASLTLVAITAKSFRPVTVAVETKTQLKLS